MSLEEAIEFWRGEYSQTVAMGYRGCQHSWHKDNKRYIYGLRHLYGQEGRRADYQSFTCRHIQVHILHKLLPVTVLSSYSGTH